MTPRNCWTVLTNKAQDVCLQVQQEMGQIQQRLQSLSASEARLQQLYEEYRLQANAPDKLHTGMEDAINERQFMNQLAVLLNKVQSDTLMAQEQLRQTRQRLSEAERERMKMQSLQDQDLRQRQALAHQREQRQMDELGLVQFNLRHTA